MTVSTVCYPQTSIARSSVAVPQEPDFSSAYRFQTSEKVRSAGRSAPSWPGMARIRTSSFSWACAFVNSDTNAATPQTDEHVLPALASGSMQSVPSATEGHLRFPSLVSLSSLWRPAGHALALQCRLRLKGFLVVADRIAQRALPLIQHRLRLRA